MTSVVAQPEDDLTRHPAMALQVLIVDDEAGVVEELAHGLRRRGYRVLAAKSGAEAWAILESRRDIGVAICDIRMSGMDGHALAARIATRRDTQQDTRVILISGHGTSRDEAIARESGVVAFLRKPFLTSELRAALGPALALAYASRQASGNAVKA